MRRYTRAVLPSHVGDAQSAIWSATRRNFIQSNRAFVYCAGLLATEAVFAVASTPQLEEAWRHPRSFATEQSAKALLLA